MKIGVSSYSFQQYINSGKLTQLSCIKKAKELGFDCIEFTDLTPPEGVSVEDYAAEIREEAKKCDIEISAYVVGANLGQKGEALKKEIENIKKKVDIANILGVKLLRHDLMWDYKNFRSFSDALPTISAAAREITEYAKQFGIKTMTENHGTICQDPDRMERVVEAVGSDNFGLLCDIGNFLCADVCPPVAVSRLAPLAFMVHGKDFEVHDFYEKFEGGFCSRGRNRLVGVSIGDGDAKAEQSIEILKNAGFDGIIDVEYEGSNDCIEGMKRSLEFLRKIV